MNSVVTHPRRSHSHASALGAVGAVVAVLVVFSTAPAALAAAAPAATSAPAAGAADGPQQFRKYHLWSEPAGIALIAYSVLALALIGERLLAWRKVNASSRAVTGQLKDLLAKPDRDSLLAVLAPSAAPLAQVMAYVLHQGVTSSPETTLLLLDNALETAGRRLKKNLTVLACVAGTAPFLGLFGTVLGIMDTFNSIAGRGFGGPAVISYGIGQALITTAGGLAVAIPTFIAYNLFIAKANNKVAELREQASRIFVAIGDV
jgi:biopolymer transport protein ExbB